MDDELIIGIVIISILYIYQAIALMYIALRTNSPDVWMAWFPIANLYLMTEIAEVPWWTMLIVISIAYVPVVGIYLAYGITVWWWWKICERMERPTWWGLLMIIPFVNFIIPGLLAWKKR